MTERGVASVRSIWTAGHMSDCKQFPTGWLCNPECDVPWAECVTPGPSLCANEGDS